ncbi:MAG TPA: hypothetical protein VGL84_03035 [Gaiellaceae bacterium]
MDIRDESAAGAAQDEAELARSAYTQELRRSLGLFSSFAVAFSYISPTTGIFVIAGVGAIYFSSVQRRKPSHMEAPEGELLAVDVQGHAVAPAAP